MVVFVVDGCVVVLGRAHRCVLFGRRLYCCHVFVLVLRYGNRALLSQNVGQRSEKHTEDHLSVCGQVLMLD